MADKILFTDNDKIAFKNSKIQFTEASCCCCKSGLDEYCCENPTECSPGTCCGDDCSEQPDQLRVVFSGITNCGSDDCDPGGPGNSAASYNGTWILDFSSAQFCRWQHVNVPPDHNIAVRFFNDIISGVESNVFTDSFESPDTTECARCDALPVSFTNIYDCDDDTNTERCAGKNGIGTLSLV